MSDRTLRPSFCATSTVMGKSCAYSGWLYRAGTMPNM